MRNRITQRRLALALERRHQKENPRQFANNSDSEIYSKLSPLIIDQINSALRAHQESAQQAENAEHRANERSITKSTKVIASFTIALVLVGIASAFISGFQWHEMHTGGDDTHDLALASKKQADIASQTLNGLERPYFIAQVNNLNVGGGQGPKPQLGEPGHTITFGSDLTGKDAETIEFVFHLAIGNYGRMPAYVDGGDAFLTIQEDIPELPVYREPEHFDMGGDEPPPGPIRLSSIPDGTIVSNNFGVNIPIQIKFIHIIGKNSAIHPLGGKILGGINRVFIYGKIAYTDLLGRKRTYGYGRVFDPRTNTFLRAGGDTYNYDHLEESPKPNPGSE